MRRLVWSARKRLLRLAPEPRRVERLGATWELDPKDWLDARLLIGQPFEAAQRARFLARLRDRRPTLLYDVGANFGLYAILAAKALPDLQVEAFEPVPRSRAKLALNVSLNGLEGRVHVHRLALSDREGESEIEIDPRSSGLATLSASQVERARRDFAETLRVRTARLDDLSPPEGAEIALKIDVEGHEAEVLRGMTRTLAANRGLAQIEIRDRNLAEIRALMAEAGWQETGRIEEELYFER